MPFTASHAVSDHNVVVGAIFPRGQSIRDIFGAEEARKAEDGVSFPRKFLGAFCVID